MTSGPLSIRRDSTSVYAHAGSANWQMSAGSWLRGNSETEFANRKFVPTSINLKNESAGDGRGDKTIEKTILRTFRARTFSPSQGQSRPFAHAPLPSDLPRSTDIARPPRLVRFVPTVDIKVRTSRFGKLRRSFADHHLLLVRHRDFTRRLLAPR